MPKYPLKAICLLSPLSPLTCLRPLKFSMSKTEFVTFFYSKSEGALLDSFNRGVMWCDLHFLKLPLAVGWRMDCGKWKGHLDDDCSGLLKGWWWLRLENSGIGDEKWLNMRYILKVVLTGFTVRYEGKRGIRMIPKFLSWAAGWMMVSLNEMEQTGRSRIVGVSQEFCFGYVKLEMPIWPLSRGYWVGSLHYQSNSRERWGLKI